MNESIEKRLLHAIEELPSEDVHAVVAFTEFLSQRRAKERSAQQQGELTKEEHSRILRVLDSVASLSAEAGPPVSNRDHDRYLYGGS